MTKLIPPPTWSEDQLREQRGVAESNFITSRKEEGVQQFASLQSRERDRLRRVLRSTDDLLELNGSTLRNDPTLWRELRYLCSPPISEEDLWTLVGRKFKTVPSDLADDVAEVIVSLIDPNRFSWVRRRSRPHFAAREAALSSTAALLAVERMRTIRRGLAAGQERTVALTMIEAGYVRTTDRKQITFIDSMERGTFDAEQKIAGLKCDVPVRLRDGRLLAIECKISNGPKNSWKRLKTEIGNKAARWKDAFGGQVVTAGVIAGVYDLSCLVAAQEVGVTIFWEHDLLALRDFAENAN